MPSEASNVYPTLSELRQWATLNLHPGTIVESNLHGQVIIYTLLKEAVKGSPEGVLTPLNVVVPPARPSDEE